MHNFTLSSNGHCGRSNSPYHNVPVLFFTTEDHEPAIARANYDTLEVTRGTDRSTCNSLRRRGPLVGREVERSRRGTHTSYQYDDLSAPAHDHVVNYGVFTGQRQIGHLAGSLIPYPHTMHCSNSDDRVIARQCSNLFPLRPRNYIEKEPR